MILGATLEGNCSHPLHFPRYSFVRSCVLAAETFITLLGYTNEKRAHAQPPGLGSDPPEAVEAAASDSSEPEDGKHWPPHRPAGSGAFARRQLSEQQLWVVSNNGDEEQDGGMGGEEGVEVSQRVALGLLLAGGGDGPVSRRPWGTLLHSLIFYIHSLIPFLQTRFALFAFMFGRVAILVNDRWKMRNSIRFYEVGDQLQATSTLRSEPAPSNSLRFTMSLSILLSRPLWTLKRTAFYCALVVRLARRFADQSGLWIRPFILAIDMLQANSGLAKLVWKDVAERVGANSYRWLSRGTTFHGLVGAWRCQWWLRSVYNNFFGCRRTTVANTMNYAPIYMSKYKKII